MTKELTPEQKLENKKAWIEDCEKQYRENTFKYNEAWIEVNSLISKMIGDLVILSTNLHQAYVARDHKLLKEVGSIGHEHAWEFANRYTDLEGRLTWNLESANTYTQLARQVIQELEKESTNETSSSNNQPTKS